MDHSFLHEYKYALLFVVSVGIKLFILSSSVGQNGTVSTSIASQGSSENSSFQTQH